MHDDEYADLTTMEQILNGRLAAVRREKARITKQRIEAGEEVRLVNDHALIRYLERHKGIDVEAIRDEMRRLADESVPAKDGEHHWHPSGVIMIIGEFGQIITVLSPDQVKKWAGRSLKDGSRVEMSNDEKRDDVLKKMLKSPPAPKKKR